MRSPKKNWIGRSTSVILSAALLSGMCLSGVSAVETADMNWTKLYGDAGTSTLATACDSINDAENLVNGQTVAVGAFDGNGLSEIANQKGKTDASFLIYDTNGNKICETLVGGAKADYFNAVVASDNGGYVAVGSSQSTDGDFENLSKGGYDGTVAKFSSEGQLEKLITFGGSDKDELKDICNTFDGGYIAVGYAHSVDGDMQNSGKDAGDRDAIIVKFNSDLEIEWLNRVGGSEGVGVLDEFVSVVSTNDGGYAAAGYSNSTNGDFTDINIGEKDAVIAKFSSDGTKEWIKTYGGTADDVFTDISNAINKKTDSREEITTEDVDNGFILSGTTSSSDGVFSDSCIADKGFILKVDKDGNIEYSNVIESSTGATAERVLPISDGYLVTGITKANDVDFASTTAYGKEDIYIAHYSEDCMRLNVFTYGSDDKETVKGITRSPEDDYLVYGNTKSEVFYENEKQGKYDGFLMNLTAESVEYYSKEKVLVPVTALKADEDTESMMSPLLYKEAYIERTGEQYRVTVYFVNAVIFGTQINASSLGECSYEFNGEMISVNSQVYDATTQVKSATIVTYDISTPIKFFIEGTMGEFRLSFDLSKMTETSNPPYFEPVIVTLPDFECAYKLNIGGSDVDYGNDMAVLNNGNIIAVGETYSYDGDFEGLYKGGSSAFVSEYSSDGEKIKTFTIGGTEYTSIAYATSISASSDGGYFVAGGYEEAVYTDPTGDFATLKTENSVHGNADSFIAKYSESGELEWMNNFSGSQDDQVKQIVATDDGGSIVMIETNSEDGDMDGLNKGLFDLALVKYDKSGNKQWQRVLGGKNIESAAMGLDILTDGSIIVGGHLSSKSGDFADVTWYGDIFDVFVAKLSADGELLWTKAYGGDKNEYCNNIIATSDGGFIMTGNTKSTTDTFAESGTSYDNAFVLKCNSDGETEWSDVIKSSEASEGTSIVELENEYVILGQSKGTDFDFKDLNKGSTDVFVAKYDKSGNRTSLEVIGGTFADYPAKLVKFNAYQLSMLFYGESTDGDLKDLSKGSTDATLLTFNYAEELLGDVNLDGKVSVIDATAIQKYIVNLDTFNSTQKTVADVNGDGIVNVADATEIQKYIVGLPSSIV